MPRVRITPSTFEAPKTPVVPVMCQPALGFVLRQLPELDPIDVWHNHGGALARGADHIVGSSLWHHGGGIQRFRARGV